MNFAVWKNLIYQHKFGQTVLFNLFINIYKLKHTKFALFFNENKNQFCVYQPFHEVLCLYAFFLDGVVYTHPWISTSIYSMKIKLGLVKVHEKRR